MSFYEVKNGDTLSKICEFFFKLTNTDDISEVVDDVSKLNDIKKPNSIFVGQELDMRIDIGDTVEINNTQPKIDNTGQRESIKYFEYNNKYSPEIIIANSLEDIPTGSHDNIKDARNCDISGLNLSKEELLNLCVDKTTTMSPEQQAIIDEYTEKMKDPGLGIRNLHEQGITGSGVKIAIIDQPLGMHKEYSQNLVYHEDINSNKFKGWNTASMHGAAVASIAVGDSVGVAPDADLYYMTAFNITTDKEEINKYIARLEKEISETTDERAKKQCQENLEQIQEQQNRINKFVADIENDLSQTTDPKIREEYEKEIEEIKNSLQISSNKPYAYAINRVLDLNQTLPEDEKIPLISISIGFD